MAAELDDDDADRRAVIGILGGMGPLATADLYRTADEMLYRAKRAGRNCVRVFEEPAAGPNGLRLAGEAS